MITRMTKYSMILLSQDLDSFMSRIQELGMVDITRASINNDDDSARMATVITRCKNAGPTLLNIKKENPDIKADAAAVADLSGQDLLEKAESTVESLSANRAKLEQLQRELAESALWGDFDLADLDRISAAGLVPHFHVVSVKSFKDSWSEEYPLFRLNQAGGSIYFVTLSPKGSDYRFPYAEESRFPARPVHALQAEIDHLTQEQEQLLKTAVALASRADALQEYADRTFASLDLHYAKVSARKEGEGCISLVEGFAPEAEEAKVREWLDSCSVYYIAEKATAEDNPPVKLKNNRFSRLFEPIGGLYELPNYGEVDLTPYFAPFYMLFFGFCLGDMGYGLLLLTAGLIAAFALPKYRGYGMLIACLGIGSIIMPLISGTFFGMKLADIVPGMPDNIKDLFFNDLQMFWFAIIFGLFQIVFARMLKAVISLSNKKFDDALSEIGWSMFIVWAACAYAGSQMGRTLLSPILAQILLYGGLVLILFCSKPAKFFLLRPVKGLVSLYDITSVFGDMLSYIRLFGLGTTGGILALVINSIGMSLSAIPYVGWGVTVIFLIVGHIAVMGLSCLGAFVHPVRLTFVEFYKNVGFEGGGRAYKPLVTYNNNK